MAREGEGEGEKERERRKRREGEEEGRRRRSSPPRRRRSSGRRCCFLLRRSPASVAAQPPLLLKPVFMAPSPPSSSSSSSSSSLLFFSLLLLLLLLLRCSAKPGRKKKKKQKKNKIDTKTTSFWCRAAVRAAAFELRSTTGTIFVHKSPTGKACAPQLLDCIKRLAKGQLVKRLPHKPDDDIFLVESEAEDINVDARNNSDLGRGQASSEQAITCIYKVPKELRTLKKSAYKPRVVSIGPIHSNDKRLDAMEQIKLSYKDSFCSKYMSETQKQSCLNAMEQPEFEARVKNCYADKIELIIKENQRNDSSAKDLVQMMFDDGCFIIELLFRSYFAKTEYEKEKKEKKKKKNNNNGDPIFGSPMRLRAIRHDLLLLENQIPFFVLEELFKFAVPSIPDPSLNKRYLIRYVLSFFGNILRHGDDTLEKKGDPHDYHILDVLHKCYLPVYASPEEEKDKTKSRFPSASDLDLAGVQFKNRDGEDLFDVEFIKPPGPLGCCCIAHFEIPTLSIYDDTEPLLRNLIAFEQCCPNVPRHISSYGFFMDTLINSAHDVELLEKAEILQNYLGTSQDIADLFNNICKEVVVGRFYFEKTCEDARNHCRKLCPKIIASLRRDYFANPWTGIAVVAAIIIFGLTIVQAIYTVLPYYKKK